MVMRRSPVEPLRGPAAPGPRTTRITAVADEDAFAAAGGTRSNGHELPEDAARGPANLAAPAAGGAAARPLAFGAARAGAGLALEHGLELDRAPGSGGHFLQGELDGNPDVLPATGAGFVNGVLAALVTVLRA